MKELSIFFNKEYRNIHQYLQNAFESAVHNLNGINNLEGLGFYDTYFTLFDEVYYATNEFTVNNGFTVTIKYSATVTIKYSAKNIHFWDRKITVFTRKVQKVAPDILLCVILDFVTEELINRAKLK